MLCLGSSMSLYLLAVVALFSGFSIVLQVSPTGKYLTFYLNKPDQIPSKTIKDTTMMNCIDNKPRHRLEEAGTSRSRPEQIDAKQPYSQLAQTVAHGSTGMS